MKPFEQVENAVGFNIWFMHIYTIGLSNQLNLYSNSRSRKTGLQVAEKQFILNK